ncbi:MAG: ArsR/SmtB family transcription factor [Dethiobacteria bacterium]|jgi:ArsR family transcriptional regulator|nr:winged helix-turn-helix transcriptional regulator [Bacillota bacterium]
MNGEEQKIIIFRLLGDKTRFQIIKLLLEHDLCVGALAHRLKISKPAVSQHLRALREAGLVKGEKRGYWTHYKVERELLQKAASFLQEMSAKQQKIYQTQKRGEKHFENHRGGKLNQKI